MNTKTYINDSKAGTSPKTSIMRSKTFIIDKKKGRSVPMMRKPFENRLWSNQSQQVNKAREDASKESTFFNSMQNANAIRLCKNVYSDTTICDTNKERDEPKRRRTEVKELLKSDRALLKSNLKDYIRHTCLGENCKIKKGSVTFWIGDTEDFTKKEEKTNTKNSNKLLKKAKEVKCTPKRDYNKENKGCDSFFIKDEPKQRRTEVEELIKSEHNMLKSKLNSYVRHTCLGENCKIKKGSVTFWIGETQDLTKKEEKRNTKNSNKPLPKAKAVKCTPERDYNKENKGHNSFLIKETQELSDKEKEDMKINNEWLRIAEEVELIPGRHYNQSNGGISYWFGETQELSDKEKEDMKINNEWLRLAKEVELIPGRHYNQSNGGISYWFGE